MLRTESPTAKRCSFMAMPLTHLQHQLQVAREMSLLGDYSSAEVYFDGVLSDMSKCVLPLPSQTPFESHPTALNSTSPRAERTRETGGSAVTSKAAAPELCFH